MKKEYIIPEIEIVEYETESLMVILSAGESLDDTEGSEEDPGDIEADAPERRGEWGNLWIDPVEEVMPLKRW